jgi:hypothetical protein
MRSNSASAAERAGALEDRRCRSGCVRMLLSGRSTQNLERQVARLDRIIPSPGTTRPFDDVLQFPHVSRPRIFRQQRLRRRRHGWLVHRVLTTELVEEEFEKRRNVFAALAQRRHADVNDIQPIVEILTNVFAATLSTSCRLVAAITRTSTRD